MDKDKKVHLCYILVVKLLFDIGGTHTRIGISHGEDIDKHEIYDTPKSFDEAVDLIIQKTSQLSDEEPEIVVVGIAGTFNHDRSQLTFSHNLKDWVGKDIKKILSGRFNCSVYLENDATLAGLGEAISGAGKDYSIVGYLTFGTGVGGAKIIDGKVDPVEFGFEPASLIVDLDLEKEEFKEDRELEVGFLSSKKIEEKYGKSLEEITDPKVWREVAYLMAVVIHNCTLLWSPEVMVLGGGLMKSVNLEEVKEFTKKAMRAFTEIPEIKVAELGDFVGLYGALQYSKTLNVKS